MSVRIDGTDRGKDLGGKRRQRKGIDITLLNPSLESHNIWCSVPGQPTRQGTIDNART
jgi:hypothetical protein